jgi:hypothetical protein
MDEDDFDIELETVTLSDKDGRTIICTIERAVEVEGQEYVLLLPVDHPVEIVAWQEYGDGDEEEAVPVEDDKEIDRLFPIAKSVLEEQNLILKRTAVTLTVEGELPDYEDEEDENDFAGSESDKNGNGEEEDEEEELQFLASFYCEEQEFGVYAPLDPFFILAKMDANDQPRLLSQEEMEKIEPILPMIQEQLLEQFE